MVHCLLALMFEVWSSFEKIYANMRVHPEVVKKIEQIFCKKCKKTVTYQITSYCRCYIKLYLKNLLVFHYRIKWDVNETVKDSI